MVRRFVIRSTAPVALAVALLAVWPPVPVLAQAQELVRAIDTPGRGKLQVCRNWMMFVTCNEYGRVDVPAKVKVGDILHLNFGSNPKSMAFKVATIRLDEGICTLFDEPLTPSTNETAVDKLVVQSCAPQN